jgi:hypothetical protein
MSEISKEKNGGGSDKINWSGLSNLRKGNTG